MYLFIIQVKPFINNILQATKFPKENEVKFKNFRKTITHPIYVVADFECILQKPASQDNPTSQDIDDHHQPVSIL